MRTAEIQTGFNKFRTVWIVSGAERRAYVRLARRLAEQERQLATRLGVEGVAHGFVAGRSPVTMAQAHVGYDVTVSLDLANWFESVTKEQLMAAGVSERRASMATLGEYVRQGLPSSPAAANIAAAALDARICSWLYMSWRRWIYTRYADDLTISWCETDESLTCYQVIARVAHCVNQHGWTINPAKTRVQFASAGRRIICGLSVGETDVRATRSVRHRLRACQHARPGTPETRGLAEWAACKLPGSGAGRSRPARVLQREE